MNEATTDGNLGKNINKCVLWLYH